MMPPGLRGREDGELVLNWVRTSDFQDEQRYGDGWWGWLHNNVNQHHPAHSF